MGAGDRGHRAVPHTADVILEAWGPDLAACCEEAVAALVGLYADVGHARESGRHRLHLPPAPADDQLLDVLEEVVFTLDTAVDVPVGVEVGGDGGASGAGLDVTLVLAAPSTVTATGAVPKAVSRSELRVEARPGGVRCRFLVDV